MEQRREVTRPIVAIVAPGDRESHARELAIIQVGERVALVGEMDGELVSVAWRGRRVEIARVDIEERSVPL